MEQCKIRCKLGILSRPDGSALYCEGETAVIAGIYGPIEAKSNKVQIEKATVEAHFRPKSGYPGIKDRLYESIIRNICESAIAVSLYPRASVLVVIQELHNSGHVISSAINAACLAALDSGIDMKCMFAGITCVLDLNGKLMLDSNCTDFKALFVFVFDSASENNVIATHTEGSFTVEQYEEALTLGKSKILGIFTFLKESLLIK